MLLSSLLKALGEAGMPFTVSGPPVDPRITGLCLDSRKSGPGLLFAALPGVKADGHDYLRQVQEAGAVAALVQRPLPGLSIPQIVVADARLATALLAQALHGHPTAGMVLIGLTGTNGKTTISYLIESILAQRGPVGVIGTVEARFAGIRRPAAMTTPESADLAALLAEMGQAGVKQVVMEVSSHALAQHRVAGCCFDIGLFTNLSRDHLDYHADIDDYFAAKRRLFTDLLPAAKRAGKDPAAVICLDDPRGEELVALCRGLGLAVWTYGLTPSAMVRAESPALSLSGGSLRLAWPGGKLPLTTALVGRYNVQNLLGAAATGLALGIAPEQVACGLQALTGVPGRLQRVPGPAGTPAVFVDYAHTDDALKQVLAVLKPLTQGRLICVFGAGGDRDHGKRPLMGVAVARAADLAWLTSDNPRTEEPLSILAMIEPGLKQGGMRPADDPAAPTPGTYAKESDRARAIASAIAQAGADDVVLIAGKGHEDYQILGRDKRHFDDCQEAAQALAVWGAHPGGGRRAQA